MKEFYLNSLYGKKRKYPEIYKNLQKGFFGKTMPWKIMQEQDIDALREFMVMFCDFVSLHESPIDVDKLTRAIQHSRSGIGGSAMTPFSCHFCGAEEVWGNTAVPNICSSCARKMAEKIAKCGDNILKDEVQVSVDVDITKLKDDIDNLLDNLTFKDSLPNENTEFQSGIKYTLELLKERLEKGKYNRIKNKTF
ncbi:hypothetical protein [Paenibacillus polymyxa]|uniref:Uncharacterized protein n=1 Tax=Paenibacillus polymyxa (strain SC2) TaxID=886882 RepID=E3EL94_PAEPS|nr:hypothetical protein [Paenibacillus polymyxa]ADO59926.1 hypothetical protein PPSC2_28540 [Paenibacillus polymyxa SC2]WPQ59850.1 hypothetical protein SKN87_26550 [Paenibacillus polymyxa]